MVIVFEISRPAIAKIPKVDNGPWECRVCWLWFAFSWVKIPYHELVMNARPVMSDGKVFTDPDKMVKHYEPT